MTEKDGGCGLDIVIPFYENAHLVFPLCDSLVSIAEELEALSAAIVAVNDSPGDRELRAALHVVRDQADGRVPFTILENPKNLGFVRSINRAAREAVACRRDVLLLNSDTIVFPGALKELAAVAYGDPMIGFVSPRSNNATICSLPHQPEFRQVAPPDAHAIFMELSPRLPRFHFLPTAVGFCLYIKCALFDEFGFFDEAYGAGYNEENDLIMRANRAGFRAAAANQAFVYHVGEVSFTSSGTPKAVHEARTSTLLHERYPEYGPAVQKYLGSAGYEAERLLVGLVPDRHARRDLVFDFSTVGTYHAGTFEVAKEVLRRAPLQWPDFNVHVLASPEAREFHSLDEMAGVLPVPVDVKRVFGVALRLAQPFSVDQLSRMTHLAPVNIYAMLDPIAYDCLHLDAGAPDLGEVWGQVFAHADGVIYISEVVRDLFHARFGRRHGLHEVVAYPSLDYRDYRRGAVTPAPEHGYTLVIGNAFEHKRLPQTVDALVRAFPTDRIVALGLGTSAHNNVTAYESGRLSDALVDRLVAGARFIVFPSVYEGFGIPIVRGLAAHRPVLARRTPVAADLQSRLGEFENLTLYSNLPDLIERLRGAWPVWRGRGQDGVPNAGWDHLTESIGSLVRAAVADAGFANLAARITHLHMLQSGALTGPAGLGASRRHLQAAQARVEELSHTIHDHERLIEAFYTSRSWRFTAPLRALARPFRALWRSGARPASLGG
jgi:GT2 family glycosyltransferase